jgi:hypothetical protein
MAAKVKRQYLDASGGKLPSVTEILGGMGWKYQVLIHWANKVGRQGLTVKEASGDAAKVGNIAHDRIEAFLLGKRYDRQSEPVDLWERSTVALDSFKRWHDDNGHRIEVLETECLMVDTEQGYGGTADLICLLDGQPAILDYKTGSGIYPEVAVQLEGYATLWECVGSHHIQAADGRPLTPAERIKRRQASVIQRTGVIHCPADGRPTNLIEFDANQRLCAGRVWDTLLTMQGLKSGYDAIGKHIKAQEIPANDEGSESGEGNKIPF